MTAGRAKRVAIGALKAEGDPRLAQNILLPAPTGVKGGSVLEIRLAALLDTAPRGEDRVQLAKVIWGRGR
jgi:hypothetical protein